MLCPFCASPDNRVVDSRIARERRAIRRRRVCESCQERFTTYEEVEESRPDVLKKDGQSEPFSREKVLQSLRLACKKRPVALDDLIAFVEQLEARFAALPRRAVTSQEVGDRALAFLRERDPVAYVRYASVYRSFKNVEEFMAELRRFQEEEAGSERPAERT
ncbi:MAG: transcriptional repressor NrdR [Deltaproteobacteria bacterium]|nr:transcriptional repressor NrdR [Deltaproteobacteria bacterium]MCB9785796.1 transcriptional repressor NrdR [Deltaproteobacteria bacterium]